MFKSVLIVCTGNICRSPIAEALLRVRWHGKGHEVRSAGIAALAGYPADPAAIAVCARAGLDISEHRAQQAIAPLLMASDLILTMDPSHNAWINRSYPQLRGRVHKLLRWRDNADVADPYGQPQDAFEKAFDDIELGVEDWLPRLR